MFSQSQSARHVNVIGWGGGGREAVEVGRSLRAQRRLLHGAILCSSLHACTASTSHLLPLNIDIPRIL